MDFKRSSLVGHQKVTFRRFMRKNVFGPLRGLRAPRIPTAMITGSNGKTTTSRMLANILACAGRTVGLACTDGIYVAGQRIEAGDRSGYDGARRVFAQQSIDAAVLETARGGLISSGLYTRRCHVAALLNVNPVHVGIDGINSVDAMAVHKRQVTDAATDRVILNLEDNLCRAMAAQYTPSKITFFCIDPHHGDVEDRLSRGSRICTLDETSEWVVLMSPDRTHRKIVRVSNVPATMNGTVHHNLLNALAAAALADGLHVTIEAINQGLATFENSPAMNPGRFNIIHDHPFTMVLDRATHPPSLETSVACFMQLPCEGRRLCMISTPGNRPDHAFNEMASVVAGRFAQYVCFETNYFRRGRQSGDIAGRLSQGLVAHGVDQAQIVCAQSPGDAVMHLKSLATNHDLVYVNAISPDELEQVTTALS